MDSPNSNVCQYVQSTGPDIIEIGTLIPYANTMSTQYNNEENVSNIIQKDIRRIFSYHKIDKFIRKSKSIVYVIDNNFYVTRSTFNMTTSNFSANINQPTLAHRAINPATRAIEQIFNNKVGYEFLTDEHVVEILRLTVSTFGETFDNTNIKENLNMFTDMIVGQIVYALKSCSIRQNEHASHGPTWLVVSIVFRRLPAGSSSIYQVYCLTLLPILFKGEKYVYFDLPAIFGLNNVNKKVVLWTDDNC
ncbi:unnamed protein product [Rotaria sp. Silwood1]|nr:unnamed protein product [Rotaria sp. Silwood1]CAF3785460.1 unnamed protein product [Rotaria sp. Silwood1]CAF3875694.1 unnamed protein product [Rotaria sp. Silwood1]CAF3976875.1 unnamed protein product [Rotaria sp. Silwood1]CAF4641567.1 unnamed protein product [Rotaria sp. Silwood1]